MSPGWAFVIGVVVGPFVWVLAVIVLGALPLMLTRKPTVRYEHLPNGGVRKTWKWER